MEDEDGERNQSSRWRDSRRVVMFSCLCDDE